MTSPGPQGYPDWSRISTRTNFLYADTLITGGVNDGVQPPIFLGSQTAIGLYTNRTNGNWRVRYEYWDDAASSVFLGRHEFHFYQNSFFLRTAVTALGPWLIPEVTGGAAGEQIRLRIVAVGQPGTYADSSGSSNLVSQTGTAVAAGGNIVRTPSYLWPGNAFLCYQATAQPSILQVDSVDFGGTVRPIWRRTLAAGAKVGEMICLTANTINVTATNTGAAPDTVDLYLTGQHHIQRA